MQFRIQILQDEREFLNFAVTSRALIEPRSGSSSKHRQRARVNWGWDDFRGEECWIFDSPRCVCEDGCKHRFLHASCRNYCISLDVHIVQKHVLSVRVFFLKMFLTFSILHKYIYYFIPTCCLKCWCIMLKEILLKNLRFLIYVWFFFGLFYVSFLYIYICISSFYFVCIKRTVIFMCWFFSFHMKDVLAFMV